MDTEDMEFKVDDVVTVDRYNHIDEVQKGTIVGYTKMLSERLLYRIDINGVEIITSGISIMESKDYIPVPDNERHERSRFISFEGKVVENSAWIFMKKK